MQTDLDRVSFRQFEKCYKSLCATAEKNNISLDDLQVSFEFLIGSLFPHVLTNIKEEMAHQYMLGAIENQKL